MCACVVMFKVSERGCVCVCVKGESVRVIYIVRVDNVLCE